MRVDTEAAVELLATAIEGFAVLVPRAWTA